MEGSVLLGKQFDQIMNTKVSVSSTLNLTYAQMCLLFAITILAFVARISLFPHEARDYQIYLSPWFDQLSAAGGFPGLGKSIGDYTPAYLTIMAALTYLPVSSLFSIKFVSCIFDFVLAIASARLIYQKYSRFSYALLGYAAFLFTPTLLLNSSFWGQCDVIYSLFLVLAVCYFLKDRPFAGMLCFSISFCFKLQSIFLVPLLGLLWLKDRIKLRHFLLIPGAYLVSILPAWIAGRPFSELLTIYFSQSGQYSAITLNAPNLYSFVNSENGQKLASAAILLTAAAVLLSLYALWCRKFRLTEEILLACALFYTILIPFLLPHMHERYFLPADLFAVLYAFYRPHRFYIPLLVIFASFVGYAPYLFQLNQLPLMLGSVAMAAALFFVGKELFSLVKENRIEEKSRQGNI